MRSTVDEAGVTATRTGSFIKESARCLISLGIVAEKSIVCRLVGTAAMMRRIGTSLEIFTTVIVPRCRAGIVTAFSFAFLITAGDYITPLLVGGKQTLIGNLIAPQFGMQFNWPLGSAMSFVMLAISVATIFVFSRLMARWCRI